MTKPIFREKSENTWKCRWLKVLSKMLSVKDTLLVTVQIHRTFCNLWPSSPVLFLTKPDLSITTLWASSADDKLMIFSLFSEKTGFDISWNDRGMTWNEMSNHLFWENTTRISICLLKFYPEYKKVLNVYTWHYIISYKGGVCSSIPVDFPTPLFGRDTTMPSSPVPECFGIFVSGAIYIKRHGFYI